MREDYFVLVDKSDRATRDDKRGAIRSDMPPILQRFGIDSNQLLEQARHFNHPIKLKN